MDNLIDLVGQQITPDILRKTSSMMGEGEAATQSAINAMLPTLIGAFANKGANEDGAKKVMDWVGAQGDSDQFLGGFSSMLDNDQSSGWLQDTGGALNGWLMGSKAGDAAGMVSSLSGIGGGSSGKLMNMLAPLALAVIGKKALGSGLGAGGLASMFLGQKSFLQAAAPAGLMGVLGLNSFDDLGSVAKSFTTTTTTTTTTSGMATGAGIATPSVQSGSVSTGSVSTGSLSTGTVTTGASVPSFQSGNVTTPDVKINTPDVSVPGVSTPDISAPSISTPSISTPDVSMPEVSTPDVSMPKVSTPDVSMPSVSASGIATPAVSTPDVKVPDVDIPKASVAVEAEKPRFTKVEADKRDYAYKPNATSTDMSADMSAGTITEVVEEERPLFNKVWRDKRDLDHRGFGGRWFGWTIVTAAICGGLLAYLGVIPAFLGMLTGA